MVALLNQLGLLVVWAFGAWRIFEFQITVGVLTAFVLYIGRFYTRLESMSRMFSATQRAAASAHRVLEILDQRPKVADPVRAAAPGKRRGTDRVPQRRLPLRQPPRARRRSTWTSGPAR